jgi:hypothetical protein
LWGPGDFLAGLAIGKPNSTAVLIEAIENHPLLRPPLKGQILPFILDVAASYAQLTAREEIWLVEPANQELINLYVQEYEFEFVKPRKQRPYCRKRI